MIRVAEEREREQIESMMQDYLAELAAYTDDLLPVDGRYEYPYLDFYWRKGGRTPYLFDDGNRTSGFALVRQDQDPRNGSQFMEMAEYFVTVENRRCGTGTRCAREVFLNHPGRWQVGVMKDNAPAYGFWRRLLRDLDPGLSEEAPSLANNHMFVYRLTITR